MFLFIATVSPHGEKSTYLMYIEKTCGKVLKNLIEPHAPPREFLSS